jgi:hypothetical protein
MKPTIAALPSFAASVANAQAGRDSRGDRADARTDKATTSPGLERRVPAAQGKDQRKDPGALGLPGEKQP